MYTTSGVISIGGLSVGFSCGACSSGNLPLPKTSSFLVSGSAGAASFYTFSCFFRRFFFQQTNFIYKTNIFTVNANQSKTVKNDKQMKKKKPTTRAEMQIDWHVKFTCIHLYKCNKKMIYIQGKGRTIWINSHQTTYQQMLVGSMLELNIQYPKTDNF